MGLALDLISSDLISCKKTAISPARHIKHSCAFMSIRWPQRSKFYATVTLWKRVVGGCGTNKFIANLVAFEMVASKPSLPPLAVSSLKAQESLCRLQSDFFKVTIKGQ